MASFDALLVGNYENGKSSLSSSLDVFYKFECKSLCVTLNGSMNKNGACERLSLQGTYVHKNIQTFNDKRVWRRVRDEPKAPASSLFAGMCRSISKEIPATRRPNNNEDDNDT